MGGSGEEGFVSPCGSLTPPWRGEGEKGENHPMGSLTPPWGERRRMGGQRGVHAMRFSHTPSAGDRGQRRARVTSRWSRVSLWQAMGEQGKGGHPMVALSTALARDGGEGNAGGFTPWPELGPSHALGEQRAAGGGRMSCPPAGVAQRGLLQQHHM